MALVHTACRGAWVALLGLGLGGCGSSPNMSFFVTSKPGGDGGNLGGGALSYCFAVD